MIAAFFAQPGSSGRQVTPGLGDTDPLAKDLGAQRNTTDSRSGFGTVFELPRRRGQPRRFARVDGAVVAVFSTSEYVPTDEGDIPVLPAGAVYYVGAGWIQRLLTPEHANAVPSLLEAPTTVNFATDPAVVQQVNTVAPATPAKVAPEDLHKRTPRSIWTDPAFRTARLMELLTPPEPTPQ